MKTKKLFFIALVLYFIGYAAHAQSAEHKTYDYITIVCKQIEPTVIYISSNAEKYEEIKINKSKGDYDYYEVINLIKKYEKEGYELFTNSFGGVERTCNYFLLRKEHKE